jgi:hypothetical protein
MKGTFNNARPVALSIYQRTADRGLLFYSVIDFLVYFTLLCTLARRFRVPVLGVCPMFDHIHVLTKNGSRKEVSPFFRELNKGYTESFNSSTGRKGPLFEKGFGAAEKHGEKTIKTSYSYVYNNPVEKKLAAVSQNYRWTFLAYATSDHPFSEKIVLRKASMDLRRALKEVQAFRKKDAPLSEPCLRRLFAKLDYREKNQLVDYIISRYNCIDYSEMFKLYGSYEKACLAFASNQGSEYDMKEDFDPYSHKAYVQMCKYLVSNKGLESAKDVLRLPDDARVVLFQELLMSTSATPRQVEKFLHLFRVRGGK